MWVRLVRIEGGPPIDFHYSPDCDPAPPEFIISLPRSENEFTCRLYRKRCETTSYGDWANGPPPFCYATYEELRDGAGVYVASAVPDTQLGAA